MRVDTNGPLPACLRRIALQRHVIAFQPCSGYGREGGIGCGDASWIRRVLDLDDDGLHRSRHRLSGMPVKHFF
jgi:hypothetical protein